MSDQSSGARRIVERYNTRLRCAFPIADINKLIPDEGEARSLFHGRIEMFLSGIAGYASSADRLNRRPEPDLRAARLFLSQPFFEKYREYADYRARITPEETPVLFLEMEAAEFNRLDLLAEVERLLNSE
jgi:hypothetical protein